MVLEFLAWEVSQASVALLPILLSPEKGLLCIAGFVIRSNYQPAYPFVNQQLWLQHLLPLLSCCEKGGKEHWGQGLSDEKASVYGWPEQCVPPAYLES